MQVKSSVQPVCNDIAISVTIVTKNRAEQLAKGLKSLVDQRFPQKDFEVIVADNGSSDHSRAVIENYATKISVVYLTLVRDSWSVGTVPCQWHGVKLTVS